MPQKSFLIAVIYLLSAFYLPFVAYAENAKLEVWRFGLEEIEGSVQDIYAQEFKKRIEEKTQGRVLVDIYSYGMLGESEDLTTLTSIGTLQLTHASVGIIGSLIPQMQVFNIPYLFSANDAHNQSVLSENPAIYTEIGNALIDQNMRLLTLYLEGDMVWTTNKAIRRPGDFDDFRMRVMNSPLVVETFQQYGAETIPLPYSQVYGALQAHIVDGQSNPIFAIEEMKFYEVTDYLIWAGQSKFVTSVIANQPWYLTLSNENKQVLNDTIKEMSNFIFKQQNDLNKSRLKMIQETKPDVILIRLSNHQKNAFRKLAQPIKAQFLKQTGSQGERLLSALEKAFASKK